MTIKLYFAPGACSFVPHTLLEASGEPFEAVMVKIHKGENHGPEYQAINPRSQVPALAVGDKVITQIVAIVSYLNDRFPGAGYLPVEPLARAKVLETLAWMNNTVHPTFTHIFMPHKFSGDAQAHAELKTFNTQLFRGMLQELEAMACAAFAEGRQYLG
ncbi:MAG TPA: glutathione S-transferase N-terminal domain-containing protein, partial [Burkholderiaceae bacterium]|nr:glutathione S-transferase N-terminal domain-containing protein [Burkholderiaceae bacterium]